MNSKAQILGPIILTLLLATISIAGCDLPLVKRLASLSQPQSQVKVTPGQIVTLDGYDATGGITVLWIALWKDYKNRGDGISATANHGEGVKFINREGDGVLVETRDGRRGWVTALFIKEFK